jgi:hypothetical protein
VEEKDAYPSFSFDDISVSSIECLPSTSWEMDSNANLSWNLSDSGEGKTVQKLKSKIEVSPPVKTSPSTWQYPEYEHFQKRLATFQEWSKF